MATKTRILPALVETVDGDGDVVFVSLHDATLGDIRCNIKLEKSRERRDVERVRQLNGLLGECVKTGYADPAAKIGAILPWTVPTGSEVDGE